MQKDKIRVIQVGCGSMAQNWCRIAKEHPRIEQVGLVDIRREAAEATAQKHELDKSIVFDTLAEAIERTQADAVFDVTIPEAHPSVTIEALEAGCHVLGEKPMGDTLENARRMVQTSRRTGLVYAVAQTRRPTPTAVAVQQAVADGIIGEVQEVHVDFYIGARFTTGFRAHMRHPLLVDMAIHTFDQGRQISGVNPKAVICHSFNPSHSWYDHHGSAIAIFEAERGVVFSYRGSWCSEGLNTSWNGLWRLIGTKGTLTWDGSDEIRCQVVADEASDKFFRELADVPVPGVELPHTGHAGIIHNFVDHLLDDKALWCPCDDNIKSFAMVCGAVASADAGGVRTVLKD